MSFNIPSNIFPPVAGSSFDLFETLGGEKAESDTSLFGAENIKAEPMSFSENDIDEASEFNALACGASDIGIRFTYGGQHYRDIPYPLKMNKHFGDVWHTSPTTFKIVFGVGDGDKPYTHVFEFDAAPDCIEDKNSNIVYRGTIKGTKVELISKDNKIVGITQYSDEDKVIGTINYDPASGDKIVKEYYKDGKTLKYNSVEGLDGVYSTTEYYENGNLARATERKPDGSYYEAGYTDDGGLWYKRYVNSDGCETLNARFYINNNLTGLTLNGGEVELDMQDYEKSSTPEGYKYTSPDGKTAVVLTQDGGYSVTVDGVTKKYNEKGEPVK